MNRINFDTLPEMIEFLDWAGYRVIPKVDILRLRAIVPVDTMYVARDPAVIETVTNIVASMIGRELRTVLKLDRSEDDKTYLTATYRTVLEVIKP